MHHIIQLKEKVLIYASLLFNGLYLIDRSDVTWGLGTLMTVLGIVNYILQIRKHSKKD